MSPPARSSPPALGPMGLGPTGLGPWRVGSWGPGLLGVGLLAPSAAAGCSTFDPPSAPPSLAAAEHTPIASAPRAGLLVVLEGMQVRLHDAASGEALAESERMHWLSFRAVAIAPDGGRVVVSTWQGKLLQLERRSAALVVTAKVAAKDEFTVAPAFRGDGALAIGRGAFIDVWLEGDLRRPPRSLEIGRGAAEIAFRPTDGAVAVAFGDRVETWSVEAGRLLDSFARPAADHVALSPNGTLAAGGTALVVREPQGDRWELEGPEGCKALAWDGAGDAVACVASETSWVCARERCEIVAPEAGQGAFTTVVPAADGLYFASGDGRVLHRSAKGARRSILIDGIFDRPRGGR